LVSRCRARLPIVFYPFGDSSTLQKYTNRFYDSGYERRYSTPLLLGRPCLNTAKIVIDVHKRIIFFDNFNNLNLMMFDEISNDTKIV
jgi:hypothetical protein